MAEFKRYVKAFGEWVEAQPRGLTERLFDARSIRQERANNVTRRVDLFDLEIEAIEKKRLEQDIPQSG